MSAVRLASTVYNKIWGSTQTEPWYPNPDGRLIGEIWFAADLPLLVKFLFTSERLSVQVHPNDEYARKHHQSRGKTEMWYVLRAEPDSKVAVGLREPMTESDFLHACETGDIAKLVNWVPARAGDTFFIPAGTVHAIGEGLVLCEVQQLSDVTYRLFDYWRPNRELHLEHGLRVAHLASHDGSVIRSQLDESRELLAECPYFRTERLCVKGTVVRPSCPLPTIYVALEGQGTIAGSPFHAGEAWEVPSNSEALEITSERAVFLTTSELSR
ncbi:MAG TPA: type I phosphomannose isomerase catalytic subunit [Bryobacteraceae bacterium]|nr:type I phosphomannose isomerase catalytic subunit [Bryobacteraceae bacterium]